MNLLITEIVKSLESLKLGLEGQLTVSDKMEKLILSLSMGKIPINWERKAYPSERALGSWIENLMRRIEQL